MPPEKYHPKNCPWKSPPPLEIALQENYPPESSPPCPPENAPHEPLDPGNYLQGIKLPFRSLVKHIRWEFWQK